MQAAYIIAGILFIAALAGLSKHETAKRGNICGWSAWGWPWWRPVLLALRQSPSSPRGSRCS